MPQQSIRYHVAEMDGAWGIFRDGQPIARRDDMTDAIAFANFFADRESLTSPLPVKVTGGPCLQKRLREERLAA
ncbi:hypothetical protein P3W24_00215 [Luteibacter sp. PPL201]|uniref:DUF2188 domain-containing protein n=1 Tax=Luteibacter sahnii TaxID=3021977 RepID=A0ABT6B688_9GAMM